MNTAIITGASEGFGRELAVAAAKQFPEIESFWLIARSEDKLRETAAMLPDDVEPHILPLDLCQDESFDMLVRLLDTVKPNVTLLVNNAGCGYLGNVGDGPLDHQVRMVDLNVRSLTAVTHLVLPYMEEGARVVNISSIAAFCPNPRMTVYSASKAYVTAFTQGIGYELRDYGITTTAVCPGPMETNFIYSGGIKGNSETFEKLPYCNPVQVARGAMAAAARGKAVYTPKMFYRFFRFVAKILPHSLVMHMSKT